MAQARRLRSRARSGPIEPLLVPARKRGRKSPSRTVGEAGGAITVATADLVGVGQRPDGTSRRLPRRRRRSPRPGRLRAARHPRQRRPVGHEGPQLPGPRGLVRPGLARGGGPLRRHPRGRPRPGPGHRGRRGPDGGRGRLRLRRLPPGPALQDPQAGDGDRDRGPGLLGRTRHHAQARPDAEAPGAAVHGPGRLRRRRAAVERRRGRGPEMAGPGLGRRTGRP